MKFWDRVAGRMADELPERVLFGRWHLHPEDGDSESTLNGCPAHAGHALIPDAAGDFLVGIAGESDESDESDEEYRILASGQFFSHALPDQQDADAVRVISADLSSCAEDGWLMWSEISPIAPGLASTMEPHPLEEHIARELSHLREVCRAPRTHIRIDSECVPVARARRLAPHAFRWLASHTEDWSHRKLSGVEPRRVQAQVREEQWDLYENRLVARLIDHLVAWLRDRIRRIVRVRNGIFKRLHSFRIEGANRHLMNRICRLWGQAWEDDASHGQREAGRAIARLDGLLYGLLALMDSPLYRHVARTAQVGRTLRMTNLLRNDEHYRGVARLWREWMRAAASSKLSRTQRFQRHQELVRNFDTWCMLVVIRACVQLRLEPREEDLERALTPGCTLSLQRDHELVWHEDGAAVFRRAGRDILRLVPLLQPLTAGERRQMAPIARLRAATEDNRTWTVILHLASPDADMEHSLASVGNPPAFHLAGAVDFVRVSPFSLDSVERVARAIRWATCGRELSEYPPLLAVSPPATVQSAFSPYIAKLDDSTWRLRALPDQRALRLLNDEIASTQARYDERLAKRDRVERDLQAARGDRRATSRLNREKKTLLEPIREAEQVLEALQRFAEALHDARRQLDTVSACPACGQPVSIQARSGQCFIATCSVPSCEAHWGVRYYSGQSLRIPFFQPGSLATADYPESSDIQQLDRLLGCDMLTLPVRTSGLSLEYRPPRQTRWEPR